MIKTTTPDGKKIIEYGDGDVYSMSFSSKDVAGLALYNGEKGEVGRELPKSTETENKDILENKTQVLFVFKSIEAVDVVIKNLQSIRKHFTDKEQV